MDSGRFGGGSRRRARRLSTTSALHVPPSSASPQVHSTASIPSSSAAARTVTIWRSPSWRRECGQPRHHHPRKGRPGTLPTQYRQGFLQIVYTERSSRVKSKYSAPRSGAPCPHVAAPIAPDRPVGVRSELLPADGAPVVSPAASGVIQGVVGEPANGPCAGLDCYPVFYACFVQIPGHRHRRDCRAAASVNALQACVTGMVARKGFLTNGCMV